MKVKVVDLSKMIAGSNTTIMMDDEHSASSACEIESKSSDFSDFELE